MIKALMHGCNGHMGRVITDLCKDDSEIEIVAGVDKYKGVDNSYPVVFLTSSKYFSKG